MYFFLQLSLSIYVHNPCSFLFPSLATLPRRHHRHSYDTPDAGIEMMT